MIGGEEGGRLTGGMDRQLRGLVMSLFLTQRLRGFLNKERGSVLESIADLIDSGKVTPSLHRSYSLDRAQEAMRDLEAGEVAGKVAITL